MFYLLYFIFGFITGLFLDFCSTWLTSRKAIAILQPHQNRKIIVGILTGLLFVLCFVSEGFSIYFFRALVLTCFLIVITVIDYDYQFIFDKVLVCLAIVGLTINLYIGKIGLLDMLSAGLFGGGIFLLIALISKGGFGGGDIKFMAALGIWMGMKYILLTMFLTFLIGGLCAAVLLLMKIKTRKDNIAYGPSIALAVFLTLLYGERLLNR